MPRPVLTGVAGLRRWGPWLLLLLVIGLSVHGARRRIIQSWFGDGRPGRAPALTRASAPASPIIEPAKVRVVLIDGLGLATARTLPNLDALCGRGLDLVIDTGFPTVSLPVQHALWTGHTQQQSGVVYRIEGVQNPPAAAIPGRVADSIGVAEAHPEIVGSFGFAQTVVPPEAPDRASIWRDRGFAEAAEAAVAGDAPLAFVHVLRVDEAGHASGADSTAYRTAARWADDLLDRWVAAPGGQEPRLWIVLADHGHRPGGGHGGAEDSIRLVRGCMFGPGLRTFAGRGPFRIHLVDVTRAITDALALSPGSKSVGRPLAVAMAHPDPGATLPRPAAWQWMVAVVLVAVAWAGALWAVAWRWGWLPWWLPGAYLGIWLVHGAPTLSNPVVYPPVGLDMLLGGLPGAAVLLVTLVVMLPRRGVAKTLLAQLLPALAMLLGAAILAADHPPVVPLWTAQVSVLATLVVEGSGVAILAQVLVGSGALGQR